MNENSIETVTKEQVCIVVPAYKAQPTANEIVSLKQLKRVLGGYHRCLVIPEGLDVSKYLEVDGGLHAATFKRKYFESLRGYNSLCMSPFFYKLFLRYRYMLVYQLDCFVFKDELIEWCNEGYDYVGPPWINKSWILKKVRFPRLLKYFSSVGNGGFSLRNVRKFYNASRFLSIVGSRIVFQEDIIWSNIVRALYPSFRIADFQTALKFGFGGNPESCYELTGHRLPFGCHAWEKSNPAFWKDIIRSYGHQIT